MSLRLLAPAEKESLIAELEKRYGFDTEALDGCALLEDAGDFWAAAPQVLGLPLRAIRTDSVGLMVARHRGGALEPTVAGLQLLGKPRKVSLVLQREEARAFIERRGVSVDAAEGVYVVFHGDHAVDLGAVVGGTLTRVQ